MREQSEYPQGGAGPDPERQNRARRLAHINRWLQALELALGIAIVLAFLLTGANTRLRDNLPALWPLHAPLFAAAFFGAYAAALSPLQFLGGFVLPRRYGLLTQSPGGWLRDRLKALAIGALIALGLVELLYLLLNLGGSLWWLWVALSYWAVAVSLSAVAPVVLLPLFFTVRPLEDRELRERIERLSETAGVRVQGVYVWSQSEKGTTANAALMGLGRTRRVVVSDTLLDHYTPEEIEVILAHELAHHAHRDIPTAILIELLLSIASFWLASRVLGWGVDALELRGRQDIAALPLVTLTLGAFALAIGPFQRAYSRFAEARADQYALRVTGRPGAFMSMMAKLTDQNLGEADPAAWVRVLFYDHPTYGQRVAMARQFEASS